MVTRLTGFEGLSSAPQPSNLAYVLCVQLGLTSEVSVILRCGSLKKTSLAVQGLSWFLQLTAKRRSCASALPYYHDPVTPRSLCGLTMPDLWHA